MTDLSDLVKKQILKLNTLDLSCFLGRRFFGYDGEQSYLVFQLMQEYFKRSI